MEPTYSPAQMAGALNVSTTTLKRYEEQGLIPDVPRTSGGHRYFLPLHAQAFAAIRSMLKGYDIPVVYEAMRSIKDGQIVTALWLVNNQLYRLQMEKHRVEDVLSILRHADASIARDATAADRMTIGKAAEIAGVNASAIRHWEKEGLIRSERDEESGYRLFTVSELRKIMVISSLRKTVYYIENMKELLHELELHRFSKLDLSFQLALQNINRQLAEKYKGIAELMKYIEILRSGGPLE